MRLIPSKYEKIKKDKTERERKETELKKKREEYKEQALAIEKQLTRLIVQMLDDDFEGDTQQSSVMLRHSLKKLQLALRFLR